MAYYASIQRKNKVRISVKGLYFYFVWVTWLQLKMNGLSHCSIRGKSENQGSTSHLIDVTTARLQKCLSKLLHSHSQSQTCSHQTITHTARVLSSSSSYVPFGLFPLLSPGISSGKSGTTLQGHAPITLQGCVCSIMTHLLRQAPLAV